MTPVRLDVVASLALAGACIVSSCGGGDDDGADTLSTSADRELADALADGLRADDDGLTDVISADCLAAGTVRALGGAERIEAEYGITADEPNTDEVALSPVDARAVAAAYSECGDLRDAFKATMTSDDFVTDEVAECVLEGIGADVIERVFEESLRGIVDGPLITDLFETMASRAVTCDAG